MSAQVEYFSTTKFVIKSDKINKFKEIVDYLNNEENIGSGYYSSEHYLTIKEYGNNTFSIHTGGYCDGGPDILDTVIFGFDKEKYENEEEQNSYNGSHSVFNLIQELLEENSWFFVDATAFENGRINNSVYFHHANGNTEAIDIRKQKKLIIDKYEIKKQ